MRLRRRTKKKLVVFIIIFILLVDIILAGLFFLKGLKEDRDATKKQMQVVEKKYNKFSNDIDDFNDIRNDLYLELFDNTYYDTFIEKDEEFKTKLKEYETTVDNVSTSVKDVDKLCNGVYYPDGNINAKCNEYKEVYEQIVNAFVSDIKLYNENIEKVNEYAKDNKLDKVLSPYKTDKKYIDYNKDKKYAGKDE